jgi:hypothetical protein
VKNYESLAKIRGCEFSVIIKVKRGDPNLMFRQAEDVDGVRRSLCDPESPELKGVRLEYYRPINRDGQAGEGRSWQGWKDHYVRDLFTRDCYDWHGAGENPFEVVDSIVWVVKETWYPEDIDLEDFDAREKPVRMNLWITIYKEPKKGWRELYHRADPLVNVTLHGERLMPGPSFRDSFRVVLYERLNKLAEEFQQKVWSQGFGKIVDDSQMKGMSGQYDGVKVMTYIIAGRLRIQFECDGVMLNFAGLDDVADPRMGFGSITGTVPQVEKMVWDAIKFWESADDKTRQSVHQDDEKVGIGF